MEKLAYTVKDFAEAASIPISSVYYLISNKKLPSLKVGKRRLISAEAAKAFLNQSGHVRTNA